MRVALDATPLAAGAGGLRRYTSELSRALATNFPEDEFLLASDQPFAAPEGLQRCGGPRNALERRWWLWGLNRELARCRAGLFHGTNFEVPYVPLRPSVLTLHDLSPWMDAGWHQAAERVRRRAPVLIRLRIATMLITPTEAVRQQALERFAAHPSRVVAVPEAVADHLYPVECPPGGTPYFLYVGALEPRKNLPLLVEAWREVRRRLPIDLVLAGRARADAPQFRSEPGLRLPGEVPEQELAVLYSGAVAFLYPSFYEGFGLPVLEAMQCGAAVIASRDPAITEVAGGAALQLDARDGRAWAEALFTAATRPEWVAALRARALARAAEFSWRETARRTREVYAEALRRF